jgi:hypothetical protein
MFELYAVGNIRYPRCGRKYKDAFCRNPAKGYLERLLKNPIYVGLFVWEGKTHGDARAQQLPLLTVGDSSFVIHDWNYLFSSLGLLNHDTQIAATVRALGWLGMCATVAWLLLRSRSAFVPNMQTGA